MTIPVLPPPPNIQNDQNLHVWKDWYVRVYTSVKALTAASGTGGGGDILQVQIFS